MDILFFLTTSGQDSPNIDGELAPRDFAQTRERAPASGSLPGAAAAGRDNKGHDIEGRKRPVDAPGPPA